MNEYVRFDLQLKHHLETAINNTILNLHNLQKELRTTRGGKLYIKETNGRFFYTEYAHGKETGIGRNKNRVHKLARRNYVQDLTGLLKYYSSVLEEVSQQLNVDKDIERISSKLQQYEKLGFDMNQIFFSREQQNWLSQSYERNPAYPEELKFATSNGQLMRSKSELIIANKLELYNIPYLPEMPLWFPYDIYPKYPDFTILKPNGEIIIWEHMGRMDKEDYFIKNCRKIIEYRQNGYSQNTNLIITFEEDLIEPGLIDHIIKNRILL